MGEPEKVTKYLAKARELGLTLSVIFCRNLEESLIMFSIILLGKLEPELE